MLALWRDQMLEHLAALLHSIHPAKIRVEAAHTAGCGSKVDQISLALQRTCRIKLLPDLRRIWMAGNTLLARHAQRLRGQKWSISLQQSRHRAGCIRSKQRQSGRGVLAYNAVWVGQATNDLRHRLFGNRPHFMKSQQGRSPNFNVRMREHFGDGRYGRRGH